MKSIRFVFLVFALIILPKIGIADAESILNNSAEVNYTEHPDSITGILNKLKNIHPRMYMTAQSREVLKAKMTSKPYSALLEKLKLLADRLVLKGPAVYKISGTDVEQLWQRDVGNAIPELAMAYCMTGNKKYLDSAKEYMLVSASYPTWGSGVNDNVELTTGHLLYGISLGYDWLYSDLDIVSRDSIQNCLVRRGGRLYESLSLGKVWWSKSYLHNHQHVTMSGLAAAGFALYGEADNVDKWILLTSKKFKQVISTLPPDGGWYEGISYSGYGIEYIMKYMALSDELLGGDLFQSSSFFHNIAKFRLYAMVPMDYWKITNSTIMSLGDGTRDDWFGPDYLLRKLASEYTDGNAQWLADKIDSTGFSSVAAFFLNLLWINPEIKPLPPTTLPLFDYFNDLDIVYMRSGWSGEESLSMFKCGPPIGHYATSYYNYDPYGGHTHPDVGTFQIFSHGDWLITDEGYAFKRTIYQNTLVINGKGQIGDGTTFFNGRLFIGAKDQPRIIYTSTNKDYDYVIGDAKPAYLPSSHLTSFYRHILYLKPDCWVIADEVKADSTSLFEFYYHSNLNFNSDSLNRFEAQGKRGSFIVTILNPKDVITSTFLQDIEGTAGSIVSKLNVLKLSSENKTSDLFITVIEAYPTGTTPVIRPSITTSKNGDTLVLETNKGKKQFKIMTQRTDKSTPLLVEVDKTE